MKPALETICKDAWLCGQEFNLDHCCYGEPHWEGEYVSQPSSYYYFLAGLTRTQNITRVLEIGTHMGGSILSILAGTDPDQQAQLVTVDVTDLSRETLKAYPQIRKITGDGLNESVCKAILAYFNYQPIDLLFIDANHDYAHTMLMFGLYNSLLCPRFTVTDDILLNNSMRSFWHDIKKTLPNHAIEVQRIIPEVRPQSAGIGLIARDHTAASNCKNRGIIKNSNTRGEKHFARGRNQQAADLFEAMIQVDPCDALSLNNLATCLCATGELTRARNLLTQAVEIEPAQSDYVVNLAKVLIMTGLTEHAVRLCQSHLSLYPDATDVANLLKEQGFANIY